jgi:hypothetical protein
MFRALRLYSPYILGQKSPAGLFAAQCRATGCRCAGELSSGRKKRVVFCNLYSTPVLLPDLRRAGRSGGRRAVIQVHYGLDLYDQTPGTCLVAGLDLGQQATRLQ